MNAEQQRLIAESAAESVEEKVLAAPPAWSSLLPSYATFLMSLHDAPTATQLRMCESSDTAGALVAALKLKDPAPATYLLTLLGELVRTDASAYGCLTKGSAVVPALSAFLASPSVTTLGADRAAYMLTALLWQSGTCDEAMLSTTIQSLLTAKYPVSEVGLLDAVVNLLKHPDLRACTWKQAGVQSKLLNFGPESPPPVVYKCIFALWLVSAEPSLYSDLRQLGAVAQIKKAIAGSRTEKVVRVGLQAIKNCLADGGMAEEVVEAGTLEAVEALEYEKWRDAEVYDSIRSVSKSVATAQTKHSNFGRYERELEKGVFQQGFIHSEKFWVDNYLQFEKDEFRAVKKLVDIASTTKDPTTLAVACHDIGEFARLHPQGKLVLARFPRAKATAMQCMNHEDREVAREALLCVQKLMLNRWQDCVDGKAA